MPTYKPNFFIVGAPKSGTTAMYEYLRAHPDIFMPLLKEPYFFGDDLIYQVPRLSEADYLDLFSMAHGPKRRGEASVTYLYSKKAAEEIADFDPEARIIIMLRNPVEMIYSLHSQVFFTGSEDIEQFEVALAAEPDRKRGHRIPDNCRIVDFLFYREFVKYSDQVQRYLHTFGSEQVHIIIFDDFKRDVPQTYRTALGFLGVDESFRPPTFEPVNRNKIRRYPGLVQLLR